MKTKIRFLLFLSLLYISAISAETVQHDIPCISIIPYPTEIRINADAFQLKDGFTISSSKELRPLADLYLRDMYRLYQINGQFQKGRASIQLLQVDTMQEQNYRLVCSKNGITVYGKSYNELTMGITTLLQVTTPEGKVPFMRINDCPIRNFRSLLLDVARKPISIETVKQCVEMCRWYKINYLQIHFTDDFFTFPSQKYPQLADPKAAFTREELKALVNYAKVRGVIIIPELEMPGHTTAMRRNMPELFGKMEYGVIDMVNEKTCNAMKDIIKEMMEVFYTSPYFHIGGDEAAIQKYGETEPVKAYMKSKGFNSVTDVYCEFIVKMHDFIKSHGKTMMLWESFRNKGTDKIQIPDDIQVTAYETAFQRPDSLIKNGYKIINASWKPAYVCPGWRWSQEYIYKWNMFRWENWWPLAPSTKHPIQLEATPAVLGTQMCAWEMNDATHVPSLHSRLPAFSEVAWHGKTERSYEDFVERYRKVDLKYMHLIFPVIEEKKGFTDTDPFYKVNHRAENSYRQKAAIRFHPILPDTYITYTQNGTMPEKNSSRLSELILNESRDIRMCLFDKNGKVLGYRHLEYTLDPLEASFIGDMEPRTNQVANDWKESFKGNILVKLHCRCRAEIHYTLDGKMPTMTSPEYPEEGIPIQETARLSAQCFIDGNAYGKPYRCTFSKKEE